MKARRTTLVSTAMVAFAVAGISVAAGRGRLVSPPTARVIGPYSPGLVAGKFLYVSGQGAKKANGELPSTTAEQVRQVYENLKDIVTTAGLSMDHIVYSQMHVTGAGAETIEQARAAWTQLFPDGGPALAILGIVQTPGATPVEINAVVATDLAMKNPVRLPGTNASDPPDVVIAGDRLFFSACYGRGQSGSIAASPEEEAEGALTRMGEVLGAAGLSSDHVVFVNPYLTDGMSAEVMNRVYAKHFKFGDTPARATIHVMRLPGSANLTFTGVAAMDLASRRSVRPKNMPPSPTASPCVFVGDTLYCSAKSAFIPGPNSGTYASGVETQVRQSIRNLLDGLEEANMDLSNVVATNVYLDDMEDFAKMNRIYAMYFEAPFPTRTTIQQRPPTERRPNDKEQWPTLEQISLVAVK